MKFHQSQAEVGPVPKDWHDYFQPRLLKKFPKILLVDDSPFFSDMLATFFRLEGFTARSATNGQDALDAFETDPPDIAFIDIVMPGLSGLDIARKIIESRPDKPTLLVALSGWNEGLVRHNAEEAGFDHFMIKPVSPASLREFLMSLL